MAQSVCSEKGWTLVDLPPDKNMSGYKGANVIKGTLGTFLNKVKAGEIPASSVLIIEKLDRFSRNEVDLVIPDFLSLLQNGVEIFSCVDRTHYTLADIRKNSMSLNYAIMAMGMANDYSKSMGTRISSSIAIRLQRCSQGEKLNLGGWVPKWFDFIGDAKKAGKYVPNQHFSTIQRICLDYIAGRSMYQIAKQLIADKVPTVMGGKWAQGTIANLLRHKTLLGTCEQKGIVLKDFYPPVLNKSQWDKLQSKLRENKDRKGGDGASDYVANLFRNRCKCKHCGETVTTAKSASHRLYTCKGKRVGKCPSKYSVRVHDVELDFFLLYLQQEPAKILQTQNKNEHANKVASLQSTLAQLDKEVNDTTELIGSLPVAELKLKLGRLETRRQQKKSELDALNTSMLSSLNVPKALNDVKSIISEFLTDPVDSVSNKWLDTVKRFETVLKDNDTRKQLLELLPSIIKGLIIDTTKGGYQVVSHNDKISPMRIVDINAVS